MQIRWHRNERDRPLRDPDGNAFELVQEPTDPVALGGGTTWPTAVGRAAEPGCGRAG